MNRLLSVVIVMVLLITGCGGENGAGEVKTGEEESLGMVVGEGEILETEAMTAEITSAAAESGQGEGEITVEDVDWGSYFGGLDGAAVFYQPGLQRYDIYNEELAETQRSPCSTFKIISSLMGLETGVIKPEDSVRKWSGEQFWKEDWNNDIGFEDAFKASCVWYYREVIDELGQEVVQSGLDALKYGNGDISDWEGRLNTNNSNRVLTGFWIESSLKISPKEQAEAMARIFSGENTYGEENIALLKKVMLVNKEGDGNAVYGKTGMGVEDGKTVDAWFVGLVEQSVGNAYFAVYLGASDQEEVTSQKAKEIALKIAADYYDK